MTNSKTPGERFKELVSSRNLNMNTLSIKTGVNQSGLYQYCNGKKDLNLMSFLNASKIAHALEISLDEFAAAILEEA